MLAALDEQAFMRATVAANVEGAARNGGSAALQVKKETKQTYGNRNEVGPGHCETGELWAGWEVRNIESSHPDHRSQ